MKISPLDVETIIRLWREGRSGGQIRNFLGNVFTRNQIMGMLHRRQILGGRNGHPKPEPKHTLENRIKARRKAAAKRAIDTPLPLDPHERSFNCLSGPSYDIMDMGRGDCRFPIGDPKSPDFCYCAARVIGKGPYCQAHKDVAYEKYVAQIPQFPHRIPRRQIRQ